jgi:hypothetical protein
MYKTPLDFCQKLKMLTSYCVVVIVIVRIELGDEVVGVGVDIVLKLAGVDKDKDEGIVFCERELFVSSFSE